MKRKIVLCSTALAVCLMFAFCSSEKEEQTISNSPVNAYNELKAGLATYNVAFMEKIPTEKTRCWICRGWKKFKRVVAADALGALVGMRGGPQGMIVLGAGASLAAVFNQSATMEPEITRYTPPSSLLEPVEGNIGKMHNALIIEVLTEHPNLLNGEKDKDTEELFELVYNKMQEFGYTLTNNEKIQAVNDIRKITPIGEFTESELIQLYKEALPEYAEDVEIVFDYIANAVQMSEEKEILKTYTDGYVKVVQDSGLSITDKKAITQSIDVAAHSANLWVVPE
jgi:hypothetical protein